jgi:hypothetical protein
VKVQVEQASKAVIRPGRAFDRHSVQERHAFSPPAALPKQEGFRPAIFTPRGEVVAELRPG